MRMNTRLATETAICALSNLIDACMEEAQQANVEDGTAWEDVACSLALVYQSLNNLADNA